NALQQKLNKLSKDDKDRAGVQKELNEANTKLQKHDTAINKATKEMNKVLDTKPTGFDRSVRAFVDAKLQSALDDLELWNAHLMPLFEKSARKGPINAAWQRLVQLGIAGKGTGKLVLTPIRPGKTLAERLTTFEKALLRHFHATGLCELLLPGAVTARWHTNFVDLRLTIPKTWRDVYHHAGDKLTGWTRYRDGKKTEFTADGLRIVKKDDKGRVVEARTVNYALDPTINLSNRKPLLEKDGDEVVTFSYEGGKVTTKRTKIDPP